MLVELLIPAHARRTASLVGRKCRAEFAVVISIDGGAVDQIESERGCVIYQVGQEVWPDRYDDDIRVECTHGIHFFMTRAEAEAYQRS